MRELLSARLDDEPTGVADEGLDAHLAGCAACAGWLAAAHRLSRLTRLGRAPRLPDRTAEIVAAVRSDAELRAAGVRAGRLRG